MLAELHKAQREVEAYHRFRELAAQLLAVNEQICSARPVEQELTPQKKTADAIRQEVAREIDQLLYVVFRGRHKSGHLDLEAVETAVRSAMHHAGSATLTELLQFAASETEEERAIGCA